MQENKKKIVIVLSVIMGLVLALGAYLYWVGKPFKVDKVTPKEVEVPNIEEEPLVPEGIVIARGDLCEEDCEESLYEITIGEQEFHITASLFQDKKDSLRINDQEVEFDNDNLQFIALMNNEFIVIGTNHTSPEEVYEILVLDLNLHTVDMFKSYMHVEGEFDLESNIFDNNTKMYYYACQEDEEDETQQNLITYEVTFQDEQINKRVHNIKENIQCASEI